MNPSQELPVGKRKYKKPEILVYGNLAEITKHVSNMAAGGDPPPNAPATNKTA